MTREHTISKRTFDLTAGGHRLRAEYLEPAAGSPDTRHPTLVFLHEGLGSIGQWRDVPALASDRTGLPALVYDRWGHGGSDPLDGPREVRYLHDEALTSLPEILKQLAIEKAILIGHSDGGSIALIFASVYPEKAMGVITEAAHVFVEERTLTGLREALRIFETTNLRDRLSRYHGDKTEALFRGWADIWLAESFRSWNIEEYLPGIRSPLLAIQGEQDEYGSPAQVEAIVSQVSGPATGLILPGCGHIPHHQARARVLAEIIRFIASL